MQVLKKTLSAVALAAAGLCAALPALAQSSYSVSNVGAVRNDISVRADSNGVGSSYSAATGKQSVTATGAAGSYGGSTGVNLPVPGVGNVPLQLQGGIAGVYGEVKTNSVATAYNISTGNGTGLATSNGWADGGVTAGASWNAPGQSLQLGGQADGGSYQNNPNGSDVSVVATTNRDGYAAAGSETKFVGTGYVGSLTVPGVGAVVTGNVTDDKSASATAETGRITFTGTQPTGMQGATVNAHAAGAVQFNGTFADPIGH